MHAAIFKMNNQQGPAVHRDLCSVLYGSLDGRGVWGRMDTCICMAESLHYPSETVIVNWFMKVKVAQLCLTLCNPMDYPVHGILQARILEWVVAFPFSRGIFLTQGSNPDLPHCRRILYQLSHKGSPRILESEAYPFSSGSS